MTVLRENLLPWACAILVLLICLTLATGVLAFLGLDVYRHFVRRRGVESGLSPGLPPLETPRLGINVSLEQYEKDAALDWALENVEMLGFGTVRQRFAWSKLEPAPGQYRWAYWDRTLPVVDAWGLDVIAVLDTSPTWARSPDEKDNVWAPPRDPQQYARFVRAFAARYGEYVTAYQIWDQPNVAPHWGNGPVDPKEYVALLRAGSEAIRTVDADARIIAGGLAPNLEPRGRNMSDLRFLSEMYRYGAAPDFDVLGAKAYGFWSGPFDRRASAEVLNFSRVVLLRREMRRRGDEGKPVWAVESGWCALAADWDGRPSPQGSDEPFVQGRRLRNAIQRVEREWPWMGLMCTLHLQPDAPPDDPVWGYALFDAWGTPTPLLRETHEPLNGRRVLYPGLTEEIAPYLYNPPDEEAMAFSFWGTDLLLSVKKGLSDGELIVSVDADYPSIEVDLDAEDEGLEVVHVIEGLPKGMHRVLLRGGEHEVEAVRAVRVGCRRYDRGLWRSLVGGLLALVSLAVVAFASARDLPWGNTWRQLRRWWDRLPVPLRWAPLLVGASLVILPPSRMMRLAGLGFYGLCALLVPQQALLVATACIPLAPLHVVLGPGSFSLVEVTVLLALGARLWNGLLSPSREAAGRIRRVSLLDGAVCAFVLLAAGTSVVAEYRHVALRELRIMVIEPALFYVLVRTWPADREKRLQLLDAFWVSALGVALYGLVRYPRAAGVIEAGGLRRARAFYGSPNNLALIMERALPLGLSMVMWGRSRTRRWLYGLGTIPVALVTLLTFSRASWLLGLPVVVLALLLLGGRRLRWIGMALLLAGGLLLIPLFRTERFASLLNPTQGTLFLRLRLWQAAWNMIRDHPWLGVGLDNFLYYYGDYVLAGAEVERWLSHPHNLLLDFWLRLGVGGVLLLVAFLAGFFRRVHRMHLASCRDGIYAGVMGFGAGMLVFVIHGSVDSSYFVTELAYWFMFALAWVNSLVIVEREEGIRSSE